MKVNGNTEGIKRTFLEDIEEKLEMVEIAREDFAPRSLCNLLSALTRETGREVSAYLGRNGELLDVTIGESWHVPLADIHVRRSLERLSGVRCLHTHPGGDATLSPVDLQALQKMRFDAIAAIGVTDARITGISAAFVGGPSAPPVVMPVIDYNQCPQEAWMREIRAADERMDEGVGAQTEEVERAFLIGLGEDFQDNDSLKELAQLAQTAGVVVLGGAAQKRARMDAATYIGRGKAEELMYTIQGLGCDLVIVDDEISASQMRALEEILGVRVVDRTMLILDIFAQRASSHEGKLQVSLAQCKHQLTHLIGIGGIMSRMRMGVGMRGPGETKLEVDRRRIRSRISELEREIAEVKKQRDVRRAKRQQNEVPVVALVGYTNAGKSTLLNQLSGSDVLVEDKLFATLDPVTRRIDVPAGVDFLLVDTVGFINKLPHDLVDAFRSTLEEVKYADLLLLVDDASSPHRQMQHDVVEQVLAELGAGEIPRLDVFNKCDVDEADKKPGAIRISALTGQGIDELKAAIGRELAHRSHRVELLIPYESGQALGMLHQNGKVLEEQYVDEGVKVSVMLDAQTEERVRRMLKQTAYAMQ